MQFRHGHKTTSGGVGGLLAGVGVGAALMYFLDPVGGRRRRSLARDKARRVANKTTDQVQKHERDLANRSYGLVARMRRRLRQEDVPDDILEERVRAVLGHVCSHPSLVRVSAREGCIQLTGPVLDYERGAVLARVSVVPGVREVEADLDPYVTGESPSL